MKNKYITYEKRILRNIIFSLVFILFAIILIFLSLKINVNSNIVYYQKSNVDYKVNLKNNDYYSSNKLDKNMQYVSSLIDKIDIYFNYEFKTSDKINLKYNYDVTADIQIKDNSNNNVILSKKEVIVKNTEKRLSKKDKFILNKKIEIDYDKYNTLAKKFKKEYAISASNNLVISMSINVVDEDGNTYESLDANNKMSVIIPLTEQTINIKLDYEKSKNSNSFKKYTKIKIENKVLFIIGIICFLIFIIFLFYILKSFKVLFKRKSKYDKELLKILNEYDRIIVEVKDANFIYETDSIEVNSFEELLDARDNLEKPILFREIHKGAKAEFIVKNSYESYKYVLKKVDIEK